MIIPSFSDSDTLKIAKKLGENIKRKYSPRKKALFIALKGDIGAGKTVFSKGILSGLGIKRVTSPTFVIMKRYKIKNSSISNLYHLDCYRLQSPKELEDLDITSIAKNPENMIVMEWPEKAGEHGKKGSFITIHLGNRENKRVISVKDKELIKLLVS